MKKFLLIFILNSFSLFLYSQETFGEILAADASVSVEDMVLFVDGISTDIYSEKLLEKAIEGNGAAQNALGNCYLSGIGINQDLEQALYWILKSAGSGYYKAICSLGFMYENGLGVEKNPQMAVELYRKSALMGFPIAWCNLAACYEDGVGTDKDILRAKAWYEKGARFGYRLAQVRLSYLLCNDENYHDALYWFWRAAKQDSAAAFYYIAEFYKVGLILPQNQVKVDKCLKLYEKLSVTYQSSSSPIFDPSYDFNIDITSLSDSDIADMIEALVDSAN